MADRQTCIVAFYQVEGSIKFNEEARAAFFSNFRIDRSHMDMISIRYRPFQIHTDLSTLLKRPELRGYTYIHCNFCRGVLGSHDTDTNERLTCRGILDPRVLTTLAEASNHPNTPRDFWNKSAPNR